MDSTWVVAIAVGGLAVGVALAITAEWLKRATLTLRWMVTEKTCFLVSDKQWPLVLGLIPAAYRSRPILGCWCLSIIVWYLFRLFGVWLPVYKLIRKNPLLIYHQEEDGSIDADSVIYFLQQFGPNRVFYVGERSDELDTLLVAPVPHGAELLEGDIYHVAEEDLLNFWGSINSAVVADRQNYMAAQMASVYASLRSIPVLFLDESNVTGYQSAIDGRRIYVVGALPQTVTDYISAHATRVDYSIDQLLAKYINKTKTRKMIVTNPADLGISINTNYQPDKSANGISVLFTKDSLTAPILAAGRHEVIVFTAADAQTYTDYDQLIENYLNVGKISAKYLTIIGSPSAIPQSLEADPPTVWGHRLELDGRYYGSVVEDLHYVDLATGRIYGLTPSDTSANIARSLFYKYLPRNKNALVIPREDHQSGIADSFDGTDLENYYRTNYWTSTVEAKFDSTSFYAGHTNVNNNRDDIQDLYDEIGFILFANHGSATSFSGVINSAHFIDNEMYLTCLAVIDLACSTGQYDKVSDDTKTRLFNVQSIRRGAIVQIAAVSVSYWHRMFGELLNGMYLDGKSLGEAYRIAKNADYDRDVYNFCSGYRGDPTYFLMGDPAFKPKYW